METPSANYYALVTGASAGIGKQIAIECANRSMNLFLVSLPDSGLESFAGELRDKYPVHIHTFSTDLTKEQGPVEVYNFAIQNNIRVNFLANNAGVGFNGKFENLSVDLIDKMILLNVRASTLLIFLFLPDMKKMEKAYILNVSSFGALTPLPFKSVYAATKTYLLFLTEAINYELKGSNVKALSVHPSGVSSERALDNIRKSSFIARLSTLSPEQVAQISIKKALAGKKFLVPGLVTRFYYIAGVMMPYWFVLKFVSRVFRKTT